MTKPIIVVGKYVNGQYVIDQANLTNGVLPVRGGVMHSPEEFVLMLNEKLAVLVPRKVVLSAISETLVDAMFFLCEAVKQVNLFELGLTDEKKRQIQQALQKTIDVHVGDVIKEYPIVFLEDQIEKYS